VARRARSAIAAASPPRALRPARTAELRGVGLTACAMVADARSSARLACTLADGAGDDPALDLPGALEDGVDLGVAVPALHRKVADVTPAAEDADRLVGGPVADLARLELGHRSLRAVEGRAGPTHPRRAPHPHP